ncbi:hypothetical protein BHM03_00054861, partial [Ensete ventricosum]
WTPSASSPSATSAPSRCHRPPLLLKCSSSSISITDTAAAPEELLCPPYHLLHTSNFLLKSLYSPVMYSGENKEGTVLNALLWVSAL